MDAVTVSMLGISLAAYAVAIGTMVYLFGRLPSVSLPRLGSRGQARAQALEESDALRWTDPLVRKLAAWIARMPLVDRRRRIEQRLHEAGQYLGFTADEFMAASAMSIVGFGLSLAAVGAYFAHCALGAAMGAGLGALLFDSQLESARKQRLLQVDRTLPGEVDLLAMCMGAGLDFPGALRLLVDQGGEVAVVLRNEFSRVLRDLDFGHTRIAALREFERRTPTDAVRDFVNAVVQAEQRGTPLIETLRIQAGMLRARRSVLAEEAASRAGVMMIVPLMMLLVSILIILMGSLMVKTHSSGMFA